MNSPSFHDFEKKNPKKIFFFGNFFGKKFRFSTILDSFLLIQSLTIAIVFELIYYTNGHPRA